MSRSGEQSKRQYPCITGRLLEACNSRNHPDTRHELDKYLLAPVTADNALRYWKDNHHLTKLACIARQLLEIPAIIAPNERVILLWHDTQ